jgi:hypothetical protein
VCCPCVAKRGIRCTANMLPATARIVEEPVEEEQPKRRRGTGTRRRRR